MYYQLHTRPALIYLVKISTGTRSTMFTATLTEALGQSECEKARFLISEVMMKVDVYRKTETTQSITGEFWIDGIKQCYYLEPARLTPVYPGHPCIQAGTYRVVLSLSPHLRYICPEVLNVPDRTAIRWHIGNFPKDVLGCCVVGTELGQNFVGNSRVAFDALMAKLQGQQITAEYHDPDQTENANTEPALQSSVESAIREHP